MANLTLQKGIDFATRLFNKFASGTGINEGSPSTPFNVEEYNKRFEYGRSGQDQFTVTKGTYPSIESGLGIHGSLDPLSGLMGTADLLRGKGLELSAPSPMPSLGLPKSGPVYGPAAPAATAAAPVYGPAQPTATGSTAGKNKFPTFTQTPVVAPNLLEPSVQPKRSFVFDPLNPTSEDYQAIFENDANASGFYSRMLGGIGQAQTGVIDTRAQQNLPSQDLQGARVAEGWENARGAWLDVQRRVSDFNRRVSNIEQEVRDDLGGEVTESAVQAEVNNRMRQMQPEFNRLNAELTNVKAYYDATVDAVSQNFNARRADAEEKVDRAAQILGFGKENINSAYAMMTGLKNFEILVDAQKNEKRDAARAAVSLAISTPGGLTRLTPQALANIEAQAEMAPGTLAGIADLQKQGDFAYKNIDDAGNFVWAQYRPDGNMVFGKYTGFATVVPKSTSTANATSWANASIDYRTFRSSVIDALMTKSEGADTATRVKYIQDAVLLLEKKASETGNAADQKNAATFRASVLGGSTGSELTEDQLNATFQALSAFGG